MHTSITCPSGLQGAVRGLKMREINLFTSRKRVRDGSMFSAVLEQCWLETTDPGPYTLDSSGKLDWRKVLQGDRLFTLLKIRTISYPEKYEFSVRCENPRCQRSKPFDWELDLNDLPTNPLTPTAREVLLNGNRFRTLLPVSGRWVEWGLLLGEDEERLSQIIEKATEREELATAAMAFRVKAVEGIDASPRAKEHWIEDLDVQDFATLEAAMSAEVCGVDTGIEVVCPTCGEVFAVDLPFDRSFIRPRHKAAT